jgi:large subunit ribosomal protein L4
LLDTYKPAPEKVVYDPSKPLDIKFKILRDYMSQYEKLQHEGKLDEFIKNMPKARKNKGLINSVDA